MLKIKPVYRSCIYSIFISAIISSLFLFTLESQAQPGSTERMREQPKNFFQKWSARINTNAEHMFNTDIDGGGQFNITRLGVNHDATFTATDQLRITFSGSLNYYNFDFSGSQGFAGLRPWRNVIISNSSMRVNYAVNRNWGVFAMPVISHAAESGAPFWDSFTIGGLAGVSYRFGENLLVGVGGFVGSRLEDSVIGYPIGFIDWRITERLRLSTLAAGARNDFGPKAELSYNLGHGFTISTSAGYEFNRFRLDEKGNFPKGIGDFKALPAMARIKYDVNKYFSVNGYGGFLFLGSLEVEDNNGNRIRKEDYDPAPFLGASLTFRL